jgi:hypothetical protein
MEDGLVNVLVPRFKSDFMNKLLPKKKSPYIRANLDELGSATWLMIDGKTNVLELAEKLNDKFGEKIEPANNRLTLFLSELYKNGFISFNELKER